MPESDPRDHFEWEQSGRAMFDGHDLAELAKRYPTPFYLISERQLRDNYSRLCDAFSGVEGVKKYYSVKSNFESLVLSTLCSEGCGAEISGAMDMELARRAGMNPERVVFDGPIKSAEDLKAAVEWGVHIVNLESIDEARVLNEVAGQLGRVVDVGMRIDPLLSKPYYDKLITTYTKKFGVPFDQAADVAREIAALPNLQFRGLMAHIGSQIFRPGRYIRLLDRMFSLMKDLLAHGVKVEELNIGGGYPAQSMRNLRLSRRFVIARLLERFNRIEVQAASIDDFGREICEHFNELTKSTGIKPTLAIEPGRCLVANTQIVVGQVQLVKNDWVFTDISINDIPENLFFSEWRLVFPGQKPDAKSRPYNISGPTLATQDVLHFQREVPGAATGTPFVVLDTGAYSIARANQFTRPRNAVYAIRTSGDVELIRRKETVKDVLAMQVWPEK